MNTSVTITAIIAVVIVVNIIATAMREIAEAKHQPAEHCKSCSCDNSKENEA